MDKLMKETVESLKTLKEYDVLETSYIEEIDALGSAPSPQGYKSPYLSPFL